MPQQNDNPNPDPAKSQRLPCRGCRTDCPNYAHCDGKPWRMEADSK